MVDKTVIGILNTKVGVTGSCKNFKDTFINRKEGNIESSSSEIIDDDTRFTALLVKTVCDCGSSWLVNNTQDLEPCNCTGILGSLTLSVIEVRRDSNNGVSNLLSKVSLSSFLHL